ncbi:MAG: CoA transferase, partial [Trebonia sp.]
GRPPWSISPAPGPAAPPAARPAPLPVRPAPGSAELPLGGLVAVESTSRVQGPLAGRVLAMLGARVIRVEPPGGDPMRGVPPVDGGCSARFRALNRGKETTEIDIKSPAGRGRLLRLVADADVFVHNWAPGRAARLGLDAGHLLRVNPRLIYARASGWGDELGPAPPLGTDFMVQAYSGLGAVVRPPGEPFAPSLMTLTDVLGGLICAQGTLAGLLARGRTGAGQRVRSSLLSAAQVLLDEASDPVSPAAPVAVCGDLSALGADPRFAAALCRDGAVYPRAPWRFAA